jgi:NAD(P)-dependent dehydrogenase (short-subunit alcohol dehydrogenase family)
MGKYCIVTGANAGIGREITAGLLREPGTHVVMACRNMEQCEAVRADLTSQQQLPGSCECSRCVWVSLSSASHHGQHLR